MELLEDSLINQNKSKSYLISVEKATKQTRVLSEMGANALTNVENIIKFLKVEKMYELVFQAEPPMATSPSLKDPETNQSKTEQRSITNNTHVSESKQENTTNQSARLKTPLAGSDSKVGAVQDMLDKLKMTLDVPVQFKAKLAPVQEKKPEKTKGGKPSHSIVKNEEYFLEHCPVELCSIMLKFIIQQLVTVEVVQSVEQIPFSISRLLYLANSKSDLAIEKEIFDSYLFESKKIIEDEYRVMIE